MLRFLVWQGDRPCQRFPTWRRLLRLCLCLGTDWHCRHRLQERGPHTPTARATRASSCMLASRLVRVRGSVDFSSSRLWSWLWVEEKSWSGSGSRLRQSNFAVRKKRGGRGISVCLTSSVGTLTFEATCLLVSSLIYSLLAAVRYTKGSYADQHHQPASGPAPIRTGLAVSMYPLLFLFKAGSLSQGQMKPTQTGGRCAVQLPTNTDEFRAKTTNFCNHTEGAN